MQASDAEHGVMDAFAFESAVAEDLPGLHTGEDMLDAGADLFVRAVVFLLPLGQFLAPGAAVRHEEPGAGIAAVGDRQGRAHGLMILTGSHGVSVDTRPCWSTCW